MDIFKHFSYPQYLVGYDIWSSESESDSTRMMKLSNEEVMLASKTPKKQAGRKKFKETRHPVYRGVRRKNSKKWVCEVREPNKKSRIWLGTFPTVEMAARAHDVAAMALRGHSACLNFADSTWRLPMPASAEAKDIQRAAVEAAEMFRPTELDKASGDELRPMGKNAMSIATTAEATETEAKGVFFIDEEAVFGMPRLLANMAEGMLLPPPHYYGGDDMEIDTDVSLWSYSI
ncbi:dehydration-responsive element-binding protein 1B-like [Quercus lobata]|uniref:AP2/ERF domain-containing protein n=1 Tax=Quercus lobata TaxID=97700 RepID=A0A7N2MK65_QUELO|nr:dehydration-responsive element-binding protein 1B-like [Quercus lobata]